MFLPHPRVKVSIVGSFRDREVACSASDRQSSNFEFLGEFRRMETAPTSIEVLLRPTQSQSDEPSDLSGSLSPTSVYSTWQSQAVTHPIMNRARRWLTSVIEQTPMSERRIP